MFRILPFRARRSLTAAVALSTSLGALACADSNAVGPYGVVAITLSVATDTLRPGQRLQASAMGRDRSGAAVEDAPITWRSLTPATLSVSAAGELEALAPGQGIVRASIGGIVADRRLALVNPPAVRVAVDLDTVALLLPGPARTLTASAFDSAGEPIVGASYQWTSEAARIATVSASGAIAPVAVGATTVRVTLDGATQVVPVRVVAAPNERAPVIADVTPALILPFIPFTVRGQRFGTSLSGLAVHVDGLPAQVTSVSDTLVTAVLTAANLPCQPTGVVAVQATTAEGIGAGSARLQLAPQANPLPGGAVLLGTSGDASCVELPGEGRYLVTVVNAARALGAGPMAVRLDALAGSAPASAALQQVVSAQRGALRTATDGVGEAHTARLLGSVAAAKAVASASAPRTRPMAALQVPAVNGIVAVRLPDFDAPNFCTSFRALDARSVYVGTHVAILEDTATQFGGRPTLARQMDAALVALGTEIDTRVWPLLARFGDPLVMDSRLDANGRVAIVVSPRLNAMRDGSILGAVVSCDFFPRAQVPSSNVGEMLYLAAPTSDALGMGAGTVERWRHEVRGTVAHEMKHIVGYAERLVRGLPLEEPWLEEASALHAEELYTRSVAGLSATADAGFAPLRCDVDAPRGDGTCAGVPRLMRPTFAALWDFLDAPAARTPLGPTATGDDSFYGSAWSLLRWTLDHHAADESGFTRGLTVGPQSGVANLEARSGRSWDDLVLRWSLAVASDGRAGLETADATLRLRGWNLTDVFAGYCAALGPCEGSEAGPFTRPAPLRPLPVSGNASVSLAEIAPAGFAALDVAPTGDRGRRLLRVRALSGGASPTTLRLAVLRVE